MRRCSILWHLEIDLMQQQTYPSPPPHRCYVTWQTLLLLWGHLSPLFQNIVHTASPVHGQQLQDMQTTILQALLQDRVRWTCSQTLQAPIIQVQRTTKKITSLGQKRNGTVWRLFHHQEKVLDNCNAINVLELIFSRRAESFHLRANKEFAKQAKNLHLKLGDAVAKVLKENWSKTTTRGSPTSQKLKKKGSGAASTSHRCEKWCGDDFHGNVAEYLMATCYHPIRQQNL